MFIGALFTIAKTQKQRKGQSMVEWIKKIRCVYVCVCVCVCVVCVCIYTHTPTHIHTHNGILFSHEKEGNPAIWDNRNLRALG